MSRKMSKEEFLEISTRLYDELVERADAGKPLVKCTADTCNYGFDYRTGLTCEMCHGRNDKPRADGNHFPEPTKMVEVQLVNARYRIKQLEQEVNRWTEAHNISYEQAVTNGQRAKLAEYNVKTLSIMTRDMLHLIRPYCKDKPDLLSKLDGALSAIKPYSEGADHAG